MLEEILQCFDENGIPTEGRPRSEIYTKPYQFWCGISDVWVANDHGEILCSKRADHLTNNAGKWQTYFGGHVPFGVSFLENAIKELAEESGIIVEADDLHFLGRRSDPIDKDLFEEFVFFSNITPEECTFPDGEVTEAQWMTFNEARQQKELHPEQWTNGCSKETENAINNVQFKT